MGSPALSASQRAYLFQREKFLAGLEERAGALFAHGYAVRETETPYVFLVFPPKHKPPYAVNALENTCTCPFYARQAAGERITEDGSLLLCKHLLGLKKLIRETRLAHQEAGHFCCCYRLWAHWLQTLAEIHHQRQTEACVSPEATPSLCPFHSQKGERP